MRIWTRFALACPHTFARKFLVSIPVVLAAHDYRLSREWRHVRSKADIPLPSHQMPRNAPSPEPTTSSRLRPASVPEASTSSRRRAASRSPTPRGSTSNVRHYGAPLAPSTPAGRDARRNQAGSGRLAPLRARHSDLQRYTSPTDLTPVQPRRIARW